MVEEKKQTYRFAPKVYGRGVVPISREGWVLLGIMVLMLVGGAQLILGPGDDPSAARVALFFVYIFCISLLPLLIFRGRIKGSLKWRRGKKDIDR